MFLKILSGEPTDQLKMFADNKTLVNQGFTVLRPKCLLERWFDAMVVCSTNLVMGKFGG